MAAATQVPRRRRPLLAVSQTNPSLYIYIYIYIYICVCLFVCVCVCVRVAPARAAAAVVEPGPTRALPIAGRRRAPAAETRLV